MFKLQLTIIKIGKESQSSEMKMMTQSSWIQHLKNMHLKEKVRNL
jgi:hypothetical protein